MTSTIKATAVNVDLFQIGQLIDSTTVSSQKIAWIGYENPRAKLHIQTPTFLTETYGIPRLGQYYQTDKSRAFYKLPFCHERALNNTDVDYSEIEKFYNKLVEMDKLFGSEEFKVKLFGEKLAGKYEYQPIVRHPGNNQHDDDEEEVVSTSYHPPYTKVKLILSDSNVPTFRIIDKPKEGKKTEVELNSFDDVTQHMRYMTEHRMIIQVQKIYAMKTASGGDKRKYGVTLKLVAAECTNKESTTSRDKFNVDFFDN